MENCRHCPICMEVPEGEIYQCLEGHIICHLCISKVAGGRCPQCRIPFGDKKIRSRVLEEILDGQQFECKFEDKGCTHLCKRGEMTSHANACSFNPDTVGLCQELGVKNCGFRFGIVSRAEVIAHFGTRHGLRTEVVPADTWFSFYIGDVTRLTNKLKSRKRQVTGAVTFRRWAVVAPTSSEMSPLLLICGILNRPVGFLSLFCFKVWDSGKASPSKFKAEFLLSKASSSSSGPSGELGPFPIGGSMKVCNFKEAHSVLAATPINVAMSLLEESRFGATEGDSVRVKISQI